MCRFIAYAGHEILLHDILVKPVNSIINQSMHALESEQVLNGDGFGLGWYNHKIDSIPGTFKSVQPAWNNLNLVNLAAKVMSTNFFAHVRAASEGGVSGTNCHPFRYENLLFMHNGTIHGFSAIKRPLRADLADDIYNWIKGQTDSEHFFGLYVQTMRNHNLSSNNINDLFKGLQLSIDYLNKLLSKHAPEALVYLNIALTDGLRTLACRYVSDLNEEARTLHYAVGEKFIFEHDAGHMYPVIDTPGAVLISSEQLTRFNLEWHEVATNHCVLVDEDLSTSVRKLQ